MYTYMYVCMYVYTCAQFLANVLLLGLYRHSNVSEP